MPTRINQAVWLEKQNRWQIKVQADGVRKTFTCKTPGSKGKKACHKKADDWLGRRTVNDRTPTAIMLEKWIDELKATTSKSHWRKYDGMRRNWISPVISARAISAVTEQHLQDILTAAYKDGGLSHKSLLNLRAAICNFMKYCRKSNCTLLRPESLTIPNGAKKGTRTILCHGDIKKLFANDTDTVRGKEIPAWFIYAYRFAVIVGLRPGELIALKRACLAGDKLYIRESINDLRELTTGKNENAQRSIALPSLATEILAQQEAMLKAQGIVSPYIFPAKSGKATTQQTYRRQWKRFRDLHGISAATPYEMRHTFVSVNKEMPEGLKKLVIGHSEDMDTEGTYGHQMDGDLERAAQYIDAAFRDLLK